MQFDLADEQRLLQESLTGFLTRNYRFRDRASGLVNGGWRPDMWRAYAEDLGLFRATLPASAGGFGGGGVETMIILEQFGAALVLEPYVEAIVVGQALLRDAGAAADDLLMRSVEGSALVVPALYEAASRYTLKSVATTATPDGGHWRLTGEKAAVGGGAMATHFLVAARLASHPSDDPAIALFLVDAGAEGVVRDDYLQIDGHAASNLQFLGATAILLVASPRALGTIEAAVEAAAAALCGEAVGVMQAMLDQTVAYARQRQQFGQPIAHFQVLQHRMVDMLVLLEQSRSLAIMAALALDGASDGDRRRAVAAAKSFVSDAITTVAQAAVQIHGGIGTTEDCAISHYFKRATVISSQFGTAAYHRRIMARNWQSSA